MFVSSFMCISRSKWKWWPLTLRCYLHHWSVMTPCDEGQMTSDGPFLPWILSCSWTSCLTECTYLSHTFVMPSICSLIFWHLMLDLFASLILMQFFHPCWIRYVVLISMMNELCLLEVNHVPCFISGLNSSHDLPKLNWEFPVGVSPTKYPMSIQIIFSSITKLDSISNLIKGGYLT
jgi:hypothetical protein